MSWLTRLLPKKRISISELQWEKEQEQRRIAAEKAAMGLQDENDEGEEECDENGEYPILERDILPERILCPACGNVTFEGNETCNRCGREL